MGGCTLRVHDHPDYHGAHYDFKSSGQSGWISDRDSSAKMLGNCRNTTYLGFEHPWSRDNGGVAWIMGEGDNARNMHDGNVHGKGKGGGGRDHRWHKRGDRLHEVVKIDIPTENINEGRMREDITIYGKRLDHRSHEWGHFPDIRKTSDGRFSAADSDQWLKDQNHKGKACPGGDAYWKGFQKIACVYDIKTGPKLGRIQTLHGEVKGSNSGDPRKAMFENIINRYCDRADRLEDRIKSGGGVNTCRSVSDSKDMAKQFCKNGDKIKTNKTFCNNEELGQALYEQLAGDYCKSKPTDEWCACYNVMTHKDQCTKKANLPGCEDVAEQVEMMEEELPPDAMARVKGTEVCWGSCTGSDTDTFIPKEYDKGGVCNRDVAICVSNITAGNLRDSGIKVEQNCGNKGVPDSESSGSGSGKDGLKRSDTEAGVINDTKTAESIMNRERFYEKSSFKWGGGAAVSSSSCLICIITIVVLFL